MVISLSSSLALLSESAAVDLVAGVLAVEEAVLVLALLVYFEHHLLVLLQLVVREEYGKCLILLKGQPLADHLQELLKCEVIRDQVPAYIMVRK